MSEELSRAPDPFRTIAENPESHQEPVAGAEEDSDSDAFERDDVVANADDSLELGQDNTFNLDDHIDLDAPFVRKFLSPSQVNEPPESSGRQTRSQLKRM
jgi:hypothetical protein